MFTTLAVVFIGFFMLFTVVGGSSMFLYGLVYLLVGPFVVRIFFEFLMLFILLVKNTIDINKKLPGGKAAPRAPRAERRYAASRVPSENYDDTPDIGDIL